MLVRRIDPVSPDESVLLYAAKIIKGGGAVVFPSDSSYGLAVDPNNRGAIRRLFKIKHRAIENEVSCIFRDIHDAEQWAEVDNRQRRILERNLPGPFTFVLRPRVAYPVEGKSVGIRIPDNTITKSLAYTLAQPYTATSANVSGYPAAYSIDEVLRQFEGKIFQPDLILDAGKLPEYPPSAVIDLRPRKPKIIREGVAKVR